MIRCAIREDLDALLGIEAESFTEASSPLNKRAFAYHVKKRHLYVVQSKGDVKGYMLVFFYAKSLRLYSLAVKSSARNRGFAKELLLYLETLANTTGKERCILEVNTANRGACALYEQFGYHTYKTLPAYYKDGSDAYKMAKRCSTTF